MNNTPRKLFIECTYTHFSDLNTGIQRVVRKLVTLLPDIAKEYNFEVYLIVLCNDKFIKIEELNSLEANRTRNKKTLLIRTLRRAYYLLRQGLSLLLPHSKVKHFLFAPRNEFGINYLLDRYIVQVTRQFKALFKVVPATQVENQQVLHAAKGDILLLLDSSWHMDIWNAVEQLRKQGVRPLAIMYDLIPILYPQFLDESLVSVFSNWFKQASFHCDGFITISKTVQAEVEKQLSITHGINVDDKFTGHFTLGADFLTVDSNQEKIRRQLIQMFPERHATENFKNTYLTVGTIEPRKNHLYLLDVFDQLWDQGFNMNLCIVGKCGWKNSDILSRVKNHKLYGENLFLWHDLDDNELAYCYQHSQMLLFASHAEGFGLPIIEGLHFGLPVMASDIPVHREVGQDKIQYFDLSNPTDLVQKIVYKEKDGISDPGEFTSMFHWKQSGKALMEQITIFYGFWKTGKSSDRR